MITLKISFKVKLFIVGNSCVRNPNYKLFFYRDLQKGRTNYDELIKVRAPGTVEVWDLGN